MKTFLNLLRHHEKLQVFHIDTDFDKSLGMKCRD